MATQIEKTRRAFATHGGLLRIRDARAEGIHPRTLYAMLDAGEIEQLSRGLYRLSESSPMSEPDLAVVAKRIPRGVICLISALAYHDLTTQVPHEVHLALPRTARRPALAYPPVHVYRFSSAAFTAGVESHRIDGVTVLFYNAEKTLADCFKFRNKLGLDVAIEALRFYRSRRGAQFQKVLEYARICRVERVMRPYIEAVL